MSSQRNSRGGTSGRSQQDHRRRAGGRGRRGPRFTGARLGLGVLCILAALGLVYRSVLAGVFKEGAGIGMLGLIPAVLFFFGGVMAIQMRHRAAPVAFLTPFLFCLLADITCLIHASKMNEWKLWAVAAAVLAVLFLVFLCLHRQRGLAVPVVLLVVTVVLTAAVCLLVKGSAARTVPRPRAATGRPQMAPRPERMARTAPAQTARLRMVRRLAARPAQTERPRMLLRVRTPPVH